VYDLTYNFTIHGKTLLDRAVSIIEYGLHKNASGDPFADAWNATSGWIHHTMMIVVVPGARRSKTS